MHVAWKGFSDQFTHLTIYFKVYMNVDCSPNSKKKQAGSETTKAAEAPKETTTSAPELDTGSQNYGNPYPYFKLDVLTTILLNYNLICLVWK